MQLAHNLALCQDELRTDIVGTKLLFDKLLAALDVAHKELGGVGKQLQRNLVRTHIDLVAVRRQLHELQNTAAALQRAETLTQETVERVGASNQRATQESIERLGLIVQQGFTLIEARFTSGNQLSGDWDRLATWLSVNPLVIAFTRLLISQDEQQVDNSSANRSSMVEQPLQALVSRLSRNVASPPLIAGAFILALRADFGSERAAYAMLTFLLFLASKMMQLYKTPTISHVIFVVDMFDVCVEIIFSNATSSAVSCAAAVASGT